MVSRIRQYSQSTDDVHRDTADYARAIGVLKQDANRLTVISALTAKDKVDFFKFKVESSVTDVGLSLRTYGGDVRVQILDNKGRTVIADNDSQASTAQNLAYEKFSTGHMELDAGVYYVKVTRGNGVVDSVKPNYALQLTAGKYTNDYDTTERPASTIPEGVVTSSPVATMLTQNLLSGDGSSSVFDMMV